MAGTVRPGDVPLLGPDSVNQFIPAAIKSIQRKRVNVDYAEAGQAVTLALKRIKRAQVRKGMVLLARGDKPPTATRRFEGQTLILYHNTLITTRWQVSLVAFGVQATSTASVDSLSFHPSGHDAHRRGPSDSPDRENCREASDPDR